MQITYKTDFVPETIQIIELYEKSGLPRPTGDTERIAKMYAGSDIIVTAWDKEKLIGVSRSITDWVWSCYLSDLAVLPEYQKGGVGRKLIERTREKAGFQSMVLLLSVPSAMDYYPKVGFTRQESSFIINRHQ
jgi:N-acetylglutamate synthase-like GNAT family acetyltransferase